MDPPYGGSVVRTATTTSNEPRQRGHAIATLALATTYFYLIYLLDAIITSFVVPYRHPRNAVPILPSVLAIAVNICVCVVLNKLHLTAQLKLIQCYSNESSYGCVCVCVCSSH